MTDKPASFQPNPPGQSAGPPVPEDVAFYDVRGVPRNAQGRIIKGLEKRPDLARPAKYPPRNRTKKQTEPTLTAPVPESRPTSLSLPESAPLHPVDPKEKVSVTEAYQDIADAWADIWNGLAEIWEDPEIGMSKAEAAEFAKPMARTLEQRGWLEHTKKLAPVRAVGIGVRQAKPRITRMLTGKSARLQKPRAGDEPRFIRPGAAAQAQQQPPPEPQIQMPPDPMEGVFTDGASKPLRIDPASTRSPYHAG